MYHSIADDSYGHYTVSVDAFREQISWFSDYGFEIISLSFLLQAIQTHDHGILNKKVVITFDDGYADFLANALPILLDHKATATVFLVTDMLGGTASWSESGSHVRLMSESDVRAIKAQGISLGSHTATHANLIRADYKDLQRQLRDSHDTLTHLGESFYALAYPWGQWSPMVVEAVKSSGYACAAAVGGQMRLSAVDPYLLPRVSMRRDTDLKHFKSLLTTTRAEIEIRRRCRSVLRTVFGASKFQ